MKTLSYSDILNRNWSYDPVKTYKAFPEDWTGTALDILRMTNIPAHERLWVVLQKHIIDERTMRLFAVWCARQALAYVSNPDSRILKALYVAEKYAYGAATEDELNNAATDAAYAAIYISREHNKKAYFACAMTAGAWSKTLTDDPVGMSTLETASQAAKEKGCSSQQQVEHLIQMLEYEDSSQDRR